MRLTHTFFSQTTPFDYIKNCKEGKEKKKTATPNFSHPSFLLFVSQISLQINPNSGFSCSNLLHNTIHTSIACAWAWAFSYYHKGNTPIDVNRGYEARSHFQYPKLAKETITKKSTTQRNCQEEPPKKWHPNFLPLFSTFISRIPLRINRNRKKLTSAILYNATSGVPRRLVVILMPVCVYPYIPKSRTEKGNSIPTTML